MRAVVTGCAGFIGSHLTERLLADGYLVVGIDSFAPTYDTTQRRNRTVELASNSSFEFIEGDLRTVDLKPHLEGADVVFHLAARPGVRASWSDFAAVDAANVLGTQRVLDAMRGGDARLVFASSSSVYGSGESFPTTEDVLLAPISPYGVTKAACEALVGAYVSQFGLRAVSLRYFTVYGPRQRSDMAFTRWVSAALAGDELPILGDGSAVRDFTFVGDVVDATVRASRTRSGGHAIYNVAGGSPTSIREVLGLIQELVGRAIRLKHLPRAVGDPDRTGGSIDKIRTELGWVPTTPLAEGLERQVEWMHDRVEGS